MLHSVLLQDFVVSELRLYSERDACVWFQRLCLLHIGISEQVLRMNNERFMVPEALFRPTDLGLHQAGA